MNKVIANREIMLRAAVAREITVAREFATKEELAAYLEQHPKADKTKHSVNPEAGKSKGKKVVEKVKEKAEKVKEKTKEKVEKVETKRKSIKEKLEGISDEMAEKINALPKASQEFINNPEKRTETLKKMGSNLLNAKKSFGKKIVDHFVHELKEAKSGLGKVMKGQKPNKDEVKAIATLAVEVGGAAALAASGAGAVAGAGYLGKSLVKHAVLSAINPMFGNLYILDKGVDLALKFAKEDKEYSDEQLTAILTKQVMDLVGKKFEQGMTDEEVKQALNGEFPKIDLSKVEFGKEEKKASLRHARNRGRIEELDYVRPTTHEFMTHVPVENIDTVIEGDDI
jgi:hypothetical protein